MQSSSVGCFRKPYLQPFGGTVGPRVFCCAGTAPPISALAAPSIVETHIGNCHKAGVFGATASAYRQRSYSRARQLGRDAVRDRRGNIGPRPCCVALVKRYFPIFWDQRERATSAYPHCEINQRDGRVCRKNRLNELGVQRDLGVENLGDRAVLLGVFRQIGEFCLI